MRFRAAVRSPLFVLLGVLVIGLGCYPILMSSLVYCRHQDIDINSGRIRNQRNLLFFCIVESIVESPVSRELGLEGSSPDWRRVNTFSPGGQPSPHYVFHGAIHQTRSLEDMMSMVEFTPEAKRQTFRNLLELWQREQRDDASDEYVQAIHDVVFGRYRDARGRPISVEDLPEVPSEDIHG